MYSGLTLTKASGGLIGAHQKIDRIARRELEKLLPGAKFPNISEILRFEGNQGPDSIKRKSPGPDEEWHFIRPFDAKDTRLISFINYHYEELVGALKEDNKERAAFEASWLAHAVVDGLTPAHHYPYEQELMELRNGEGNETRDSLKQKFILPGESGMHALKNNWKMWGPKGLIITHAAFEMGFATLIAPLSSIDIGPASSYISTIKKKQLGPWFRSLAQQVTKLDIYEDFYRKGWTLKLTARVKKELAPTLINAVTAVWYSAYLEAFKATKGS